MAYKWPDLDPDEVADFSVDWGRFLGTDTIASVVWLANDTLLATNVSLGGVNGDLMLIQPTNTNTVATARFTSGINGTRYKITCRITTTGSKTFERNIFLRVRSR
tara:strand:+ start:1901 stop:2215 length:315 start_codon:yes stop_codon:yes gene_type:complete